MIENVLAFCYLFLSNREHILRYHKTTCLHSSTNNFKVGFLPPRQTAENL